MILLTAMTALAAGQAAPPAPKAEPAPMVDYRVRNGDTLFDLGNRYFRGRGDYLIVQRLNHVANPRRLPRNRVLRIPRRLLKYEPIQGSVAAFRGSVTLAQAGASRPAVLDAPVGEGALVTTAAKSYLTVEMPDASRFSLPSNSRVRILRLRRILLTNEIERRFQLEGGRSDWSVTPNPANPFTVATPIATTAVRGTVFRVTYDGDAAAMTLGVLDGRVGVSDEKREEAAVPKGTGALIKSDLPVNPTPLIKAPDLVRPGATQTGTEVLFQAKPVEGATAYGFEIATDAGFIDRIDEVVSPTTEGRFPTLPEGTYFVRVTAYDANKIQGLENTYSFDRQLNTIGLDSPSSSAVGRRKEYKFRWHGSSKGRINYRFLLSRDEAGKDVVVDEVALTKPGIGVSDLTPGVYYWRVWSVRLDGKAPTVTVAPPQKLQIGEAQ